MKKKVTTLLSFSFCLVSFFASAQVHLVTSGFNMTGGGVIIDNQSFDYSIGDLISHPLETNSVKGNIGILQVISDITTGVNTEIFPQLSISPNPSQGVFQIQNAEAETYTYSIYDTKGMLKKRGEQSGNRQTIDISEYAPGIYILSMSNGINAQNFKLIKT